MVEKIEAFPPRATPFLFKYARLFKRQTFIYLLFTIISVVASNLINWFFAQTIESVKNGVSYENLQIALNYIYLLAVCLIIGVFIPSITFKYRQKNIYFPMEELIIRDAVAYVQGHSVNYISSNNTGMFVNKIKQILAIQPILSAVFVGLFMNGFDLMVKAFILMTINIWLGIVFLVCVIGSYFFNVAINKVPERLHKMNGRIESMYAGWLIDAVSNMRFVKQFNRLVFERNRLFIVMGQWFRIKKKELWLSLSAYVAVGAFINITSMVIITFAVYLWSGGKIGIGDIVFVILTITTGLEYLTDVHDSIRRIKNMGAAINEGLKPFSIAHDIVDDPKAKKLKVPKGAIEFKNVSFSYNKNKPVFNNFSLKIREREKIGIVGVSGSGKTTIVNLLQRAYEPTGGEIFIDGQNILKVTQDSLHENIALIPQETTLFHRSIGENIGFGNPKASLNKIVEASKKAYADEFVSCMPNGYDTHVGDRGCKLSGGERQRIAIARAILKNSPILILDEATSSLDSESEHLISQAISEIVEGRTVIAIAHRLSTLKGMDSIIVLEKGMVVESGTFAELVKIEGGKFNRFYKLQRMKSKKEKEINK